ncbi:unnamed protein product, partial [marine sediment metagenome]
ETLEETVYPLSLPGGDGVLESRYGSLFSSRDAFLSGFFLVGV